MNITEAQLIASQALEIANLKAEVTRMEDDRRSIRQYIYSCSGPLNGNLLGYTSEQMLIFKRIAEHAE